MTVRAPADRMTLLQRVIAALITRRGMRRWMLPRFIRHFIDHGGLTRTEQRRVLRTIHRFSDWPDAWRTAGHDFDSQGRHLTAANCLYVARFLLDAADSRSPEIIRECAAAYTRAPHAAPLERIWVDQHEGGIAAYVQVPVGASKPSPVVVILPGLGTIKEIMHPFAERLVAAGFAVVRPELPGCGDNAGQVGRLRWEALGTDTIRCLAGDVRLDLDNLHVFGTCVGGLIAVRTAADLPTIRSVAAMSPIYDVNELYEDIEPSHLAILENISGFTQVEDLAADAKLFNVRDHAPRVTAPILLFHRARDRAVPPSHTLRIAADAPQATTRLFMWEDHRCLGRMTPILDDLEQFFTTHAHAPRAGDLPMPRSQREPSHQPTTPMSPPAGVARGR